MCARRYTYECVCVYVCPRTCVCTCVHTCVCVSEQGNHRIVFDLIILPFGVTLGNIDTGHHRDISILEDKKT